MSAVDTTAPFRLCLFVVLSFLICHDAAALSENDFAKCQKMFAKNATWLEKRAAKSKRGFDKSVRDMISKAAADRPDPYLEAVRLSSIVDQVLVRSGQEEHQQALVDGPIDDVRKLENSPTLVCWSSSEVKRLFQNNLDRYRQNLKQTREEIQDRLDIENIGENEGLVAILFYAEGAAQQVDIDRLGGIGGGIQFGPVSNRDYFRILKVKAGRYRWHSVRNQYGWLTSTAHMRGFKHDFTVEAGKLNYVGVLTYTGNLYDSFRTDLVDRTSVILSLIDNHYPGLLQTIELNNGLDGDNRFIEFYKRERDASLSGDDDSA